MVILVPAKKDELIQVQAIAHLTWPATFGKILSPTQIQYMLHWMYSLETLEKQASSGHLFYFAEEDGEKLGFTGFELNQEPGITKVHKIYILPTAQGKGIGKKLIDLVKNTALQHTQKSLLLNVNKYNQGAIDFYEYLGFVKTKEEIIAIGNGYVMDDYVFELKL